MARASYPTNVDKVGQRPIILTVGAGVVSFFFFFFFDIYLSPIISRPGVD